LSTIPSFDVAIVGAGITGLSAAWHLQRLGVKKIAVLSDPQLPGESSNNPGLLWGGLFDNYSRITHHHGVELARELWRFGDTSYREVVDFAASHGVPHLTHSRVRLLTSADEVVEATTAVQQLVAAGFPATISKENSGEAYRLQRDSSLGGWIAPASLLMALAHESTVKIFSRRVQELQRDEQGILLVDASGVKLRAQMLILACHLAIGDFLPSFRKILVPVASQWLKCALTDKVTQKITAKIEIGSAFSAHHTYEWGGLLPCALLLGGGNYLRPFAGIGQNVASYEEKIAQHLRKYAATLFGLTLEQLPIEASGAGVDIRPCDELPLIGPMYGDNRILLAAGYMGQGLTLGFAAGRCLAELIARGKTTNLPRSLWPERFRMGE
jgi:glycine/D-amino acid oxidase-like deaminating enzyme